MIIKINKKLNNELISDIIEWDIHNWKKAILFWEKYLSNNNFSFKNKKVLEIGSRNGGLSLWAALKGANVVCSDLNGPKEKAKYLHKKYNLQKKIKYKKINILNINYPDKTFDYVLFKSVLGGLTKKENQSKALKEIYRILKNNGILFFAENLKASFIHFIFRKIFVRWNSYWRYIKINEMKEFIKMFEKKIYKTSGFLGTFGRKEIQRNFLGKLDDILELIVLPASRYIIYGIAKK